jgi:enamine deaminase RidA (YjgF/YER057c/UK114 family)
MNAFYKGVSFWIVVGFVCFGFLWAGCGKVKEEVPSGGELRASGQQKSAAQPLLGSIQLRRFGKTPDGFAQAVVTSGYALVFTRQLLPVNANGKLVEADSPEEAVRTQAEQLVENLEKVLGEVGSGLDKLVRIHAYVKDPQAAKVLIEVLLKRIPEEFRPAFTLVETPLPLPGAELGVDAVGITSENPGQIKFARCSSLWGEESFADIAVVPPGKMVFFSGYPERGEPKEATAKVMAGLFDLGHQLSITPSRIAQLKVFVQPIALAEIVKDQLRENFSGQLVPPVVFVEWIATAPLEIEMIALLDLEPTGVKERLVFYNPPGIKPSPTFSRATVLGMPEQIFASGLWASEAADGVEEVRDIFEQLGGILKALGGDMRHLAKATYYVSGKEASAALDKLRLEYFDPGRPPAASKATVHGVGKPGRTITLDMIATLP